MTDTMSVWRPARVWPNEEPSKPEDGSVQVYLMTNVTNGRQYIGVTEYHLEFYRRYRENRVRDRLRRIALKKFKTLPQDTRIVKAMVKYGMENFDWCLLEQHPTKELALAREKELIKQYKTLYPRGYNDIL